MAANDDFTLDDFRKQFEQLKKIGSMKESLRNIPGVGEMIPEDEDPDAAFERIERMIDAMTEEERRNPDSIDLSRRQRIAIESGTEPEEVERFLEHFKQLRTVMRSMAEMSLWRRIRPLCGFERGNWWEEKR